MNTHVFYLNNSVCPMCFDRTFDDNWNGKSACGYQFPLSLGIDYGSTWDYSDELMREFKKYNGLRLAGKYVGKKPELLSELSHVRQLFLSRYRGFEFAFLESFSALEILELDYLQISDLEGIEALRSLLSLRLTECRKLESIENLTRLNIRVLSIPLCNKIRDIEAISRVETLHHLSIEAKFVESLDFLAGLSKLEYVNLNVARVADSSLNVLFEMKHLKEIGIRKSSFKKSDIERLRELGPDCKVRAY